MLNKLDAIFNNSEAENSDKVEQLSKFYQEIVAEELKNAHKQAMALKIQEEQNNLKIDIMQENLNKSIVILNKHQVLSTEYQNQFKQFQERHNAIISQEKVKRGQIISNFEEHLKQIRTQMAEDARKMELENEVVKENAELAQ